MICPLCNGTGQVSNNMGVTFRVCENCAGTGKVSSANPYKDVPSKSGSKKTSGTVKIIFSLILFGILIADGSSPVSHFGITVLYGIAVALLITGITDLS